MNEYVLLWAGGSYIMCFVVVLIATALFYGATAIWERRRRR